jgi:peptide/nickel transport system substrate-binding protein
MACAAASPCGTAVIPSEIGQGAPGPITSLNPLLGPTIANLQGALLLYRPLVWIGADDRIDVERSLAASITPLDGNRRIRIVLKSWAWSDGVPITADDVLFTWERIGKLGALWGYSGQGGLPGRVATIRAVDSRTVDFVLREPTNPDWFALDGLSQFPPLPRHAWGDLDASRMWQRQTDPSLVRVVDGPFLLDDFKLDRYAAFVPNPRYRGPPARLARLVVDFVEGGNPLAELHAGAIDMAHVPFAVWNQEQRRPGFTAMAPQEPFGYLAVTYNFNNPADPFFRDARVRRALSDAADQKAMVALVYHGLSHENRMVVPAVPPTWLSPAALAGSLPVRSDKALATRELDAAGWQPAADGIRVRNGTRLAFTVLASADAPERLQLMQIWQQNLREVGVELHIRLADLEAVLAAQGGPPDAWDAVLTATTSYGLPDGGGHLDTGGDTGGGYSDAHMDELIRASVDTADSAGLFAYEDYAAQEQPVTVLPQGAFPLLVSNRLGGVERFVNPQGFWAPEELWVRDAVCVAGTGGTMR